MSVSGDRSVWDCKLLRLKWKCNRICSTIIDTSRNPHLTNSCHCLHQNNYCNKSQHCSFSRETLLSSRIILYHTLFISSSGLLHQRDPLWPTYICAWYFFISNFKLRWLLVYFETFKVFHVAQLFGRSCSVLNYLTCTPGSKALMHIMWPCVLCKWVF